MLDRLQAQETVEQINAMSYAMRHMDPKQAGRYVDMLHERAHPTGEETAAARRPKSIEEMKHLMMGDGLSGMHLVLEKGPREAAREQTAVTAAEEIRELVTREEAPA